MMEKGKYVKIVGAEQRKSGSPAIIDEEDLRILGVLVIIQNYSNGSEEVKKNFLKNNHPKIIDALKHEHAKQGNIYLTTLEDSVGISRKGILVHLKKLQNFGWLQSERSTLENEYKLKVVSITPAGEKLFTLLCEANAFVENEEGDLVINNIREVIT